MTITKTTSWTEYIQVLDTKETTAFWTDKEPVYFFQGNGEDIIVCKVTKENVAIVEKSISMTNRNMKTDEVGKNCFHYLDTMQKDSIILLVDRTDGTVIYDVTSKNIVEWPRVDELPPTEIFTMVAFWIDDKGDTLVASMSDVSGISTGIYIRGYSNSLLEANFMTNIGIDFISDLFIGYFNLKEMDKWIQTWAITPTRVKSRFTEAQLLKLDKFRGKMFKQGILPEPKEELSFISDEFIFQNKVLSMSWIQLNHRLPDIPFKYVNNDVNLLNKRVKNYAVEHGILYVTTHPNESVLITDITSYLGIPADKVKIHL